MQGRFRTRLATLVALPLCACFFPALDGLSGGTNDASTDGGLHADGHSGSDGAGPDGSTLLDGAAPCTAAHGGAMVRVPQGFCIDATEVTNLQYKEFVENGDLSKQSDVCAWNKTNTRGFKPQSYLWYDGHSKIKDNGPVQGVNFCDAKAYCAWAGKRLCGKIGGGALESQGDLVRGSHAEPDSEWYSTCAKGSAKRVYPYGDVYVAGACNINLSTAPYGTVDVGSLPLCTGGYSGIFDMTGNVMEWIDFCESGPLIDPRHAKCLLQGGPWNYDQTAATCDFGDVAEREEHDTPQIGFRCCMD